MQNINKLISDLEASFSLRRRAAQTDSPFRPNRFSQLFEYDNCGSLSLQTQDAVLHIRQGVLGRNFIATVELDRIVIVNLNAARLIRIGELQSVNAQLGVRLAPKLRLAAYLNTFIGMDARLRFGGESAPRIHGVLNSTVGELIALETAVEPVVAVWSQLHSIQISVDNSDD
jgi:hypothetical protein